MPPKKSQPCGKIHLLGHISNTTFGISRIPMSFMSLTVGESMATIYGAVGEPSSSFDVMMSSNLFFEQMEEVRESKSYVKVFHVENITNITMIIYIYLYITYKQSTLGGACYGRIEPQDACRKSMRSL